MNGSFVFRPKEVDLLTALRMHYNRFRVKHFFWFIAFCALVGVAISVVAGDTSAMELLKVVGGMIIYGCVVVFLLQIAIRIWWLPRYVRRVFRQQVDFHQDIEVTWDAEHFTTKTPNSHVRSPWADFHLWNRNEDIMVLYRSEALFNFFPLDDAERRKAADQIEAHLRNAGVKRRS